MESRLPTTTPLVISENDKLLGYCYALGKKTNPPLLLIPGFTGTHRDVLLVADYLTDDYYVIVPDLPGWGMSPRFPETLTIHNYAKYLKLALDKLKIKEVTICGHCFGATLAIEVTYLYPKLVKNLILVSTPYLKGTLGNKILTFLADISPHLPKKLRRIFFLWRSRVFVSPLNLYIIKMHSLSKKMNLIRYYFHLQKTQAEDAVEENFISVSHYDYERIKAIKTPLHFIQGNEDVLIGKGQARKLHNLAPEATFDFLPHAGHLPTMETPKELAQLILKYNTKI